MYMIHDEYGMAYPGTGCEDCDLAILETGDQEAICVECYMDGTRQD